MPNVFNPNKLIQNDLLKTANNQKKGQTALSSNTQKSTVNPLQLAWNTPKAAKQTATVTDYGNDSLNEKYRSTVKMLYNLQQKTGSSFNVIDDAKGLMNAYIGTVKASYGLNSGRSAGEYLKIGQNEFDSQLQNTIFKYQHANDTPEQMETFLNNKGYLGVKGTQAKNAQNVIGTAKALGAGSSHQERDAAAYYDMLADSTHINDREPKGISGARQNMAVMGTGEENRKTGISADERDAQRAKAAGLWQSVRDKEDVTLAEAEQYLNGQGWQYGFAKAHPGDLTGWMDAFSRAGDIVNRAMINGVDKLNATDKEVYYYLQGNNGPELGAGLLGMGNMTNQELAGYNAWGRQKAQELAAVNGLYAQEQLDPETRFVRDQWRQTPDGAKQWALDAIGTAEEEAAKDNEYFVTNRAHYQDIASRPDFAEISQMDPANLNSDEYARMNGQPTKTVQNPGMYYPMPLNPYGATLGTAGMRFNLDQATDEERAMYNAVVNTEGLAAGSKYLDYLQYELDRRAQEQTAAAAQQLGESGVLGALGSSVVSSEARLIQGLGYADILGQRGLQALTEALGGERKPINWNSAAQLPGTISEAGVQGVQNQVDWDVNIFGQGLDLFDFGYSGLMDMINSVASGATGVGEVLMAGQAAQSTAQEAHKLGAPTDVALGLGAMEGINEGLFEHISLSKLYDEASHIGKKSFKEFMKNVAAQAGINMSEELFTENANMAAEKMLLGENDQYQQERADYERLGLSPEEIEAKIKSEKTWRLVQAAAGGLLQGMFMGAGSGLISDVATNRLDKTTGKYFSDETKESLAELASHMPDGEAKALVTEWKDDKGNQVRPAKYNPKTATAKETGRLLRAIFQELPNEMKGTLRANVALNFLDMMDISPEAAQAVGTMLSGEQLSGEQIDALAKDKAGMDLVFDLFGVERQDSGKQDGGQEKQEEGTQAETAPALEELAPMPGTREPVTIKAPERAGRAQNAGKGTITVGEKQNEAEWQGDAESGNVRPSEQSQEARRNVEPVEKVAGDDMLKAPKEPILYTGKDQGQEARRNVEPVEAVAGDDMLKAADNTETQSEGTETTGKAAPMEKRQGIMGFSIEKESGGAVARMEDGSEQDVDSLDIPDAQKALAQEAADLPAEAQGVIIRNYEGQDAVDYAQRYAKGMKTVYNAAKNGRTLEDTRSLYAEDLNEEQRKAAWEAGREAYQQEEQKAQADTRRMADKAKADGYNFKVLEQEDAEQQHKGVYLARVRNAMTRNQEIQLAVLEDVLNKKGIPVQIRVYDTMGDKNGSYQAGSNIVNVALDAEGGLINRTVSHELYHFVKEWNQEAAGKLQAFVIDTLNGTETFDLDKRRQDIARQYRDRAGQELTADAIDEEIAAESMLDAFDTQENLQAFYKNADKSLIEKIIDWIKDTVAKIRDAMARIGRNHPEVEAMRGNLAALEKIQNDLLQAAQTAGRNYQTARAGMNSQAAQDADVMAYQEEMGKAVTMEAAQEARNGLESALFARYYADLGGDLGGLEYEDAFQRFQAAMEVFGSGEIRSLAWAFNQAKLPVPKQGMNSVLSYAARQMAAGAREAASVKNEGQKYSFKADDAAYMAAAERGDEEEAQRMVDEAAKAAGYTTPKLYHGTGSFGFTEFDLTLGESLIFATSDRGTAETYSGETNRNRIQERIGENELEEIRKMEGEELLKKGKKVFDEYKDYELMNPIEKEAAIEVIREEAFEIAQRVNDFISDHDGAFDDKKMEAIGDIRTAIKKIAAAKTAEEEREAWDSYQNAGFAFKWIDESLSDELWGVIGENNLYRDSRWLADMLAGDIYENKAQLGFNYTTAQLIRDKLEGASGIGIYEMYGRTGKQLVIDGEGGYWNEITPPEELGLYGPQKTRDIASAAIEKGYDSVLIKNLMDWGGATNYKKPSDIYIFFNSEDVKSADPITYDDAGNVIPLSERFNEEKPDIRYSFKADADYMAAAERGDEEEAQRMVDQAARAAGYSTETAYHGTEAFGFTVFDLDQSQGQIFVAYNPNISKTYGSGLEKEKIGRIYSQETLDRMGSEQREKAARNFYKDRGFSNFEVKAFSAEEFKEKVTEDIRALNQLAEGDAEKERLMRSIEEYLYDGETANEEKERKVRLDAYKQFDAGEFGNKLRQFINYTWNAAKTDNDKIGVKAYGMWAYDSWENLSKRIRDQSTNRPGIYSLYTRPGNQLVVEGYGTLWNRIRVPWDDRSYGYWNTRMIADYAKKNGYDSVRINNIYDHGGRWGDTEDGYGDVGIFFNGNDVKSADPITYDDAGNVIPLSERFNTGNQDIRYELRGDTEADAEQQALEDVREDAELYSQIKQDEDARAALLMLRQLHALTTQGGADALIKPGAFEKRLSDIVSKIEEETGTKYGHNKLMAALRKVYKAMEQRDYNLGEILQYTRGIMQDVLEKAPGVLVEQDEATQEVIRILKTRPFYLSSEQKSEIAGTYGALGDYMRKNFGKMRIRKQSPTTASLADVWREDLAPILPGTFAEDTSELDMPGILDAWLENANKKKFAGEFGANIGAYATNQALNAMLDFYDVPGALKTKEEIRQGFQERFNEQRAQINQLKETARGAVDQARLQYEERYRNRIEKDQARKNETERKQKLRGQITRDVKAINTLNTSMTDTRHVPESMRAAALAAVEPFISNSGVFSGAAQIRLAHEYELLKQRAGEIGGFDEDILETINGLGERLNGRRLSQLTEQELQDLADITGNLRKIIADTNEAFVNGRKTTIDALSARLKQDMRNKGPARQGKAAEAARALSYRETTPTYFADRVGGVIRDMIKDLYAGQNTWAFAMNQAKAFLGEDGRKKSGVMGKYHVNDWINDKQHARFTTQHGDMIELNRQEALSLYALWKRETTNKLQNANHLRVGGFMYDKGTRYEGVDTLRPHPLTESDMKMIRDYLTEEQKAFADEMVKYLSEDMAKIGNETSMRLYGYEKFKENYYFPYDTDRRYLVGDLTQDGEKVKQPKSAGMTKALMQNAATPITVKPFTEVWASHVNQMGLYAGFAEAIDTMSRVFNKRESGQLIEANGEEYVITPESNWIEMEKALGAEGVKYLKTLARDVSGGVRADERSLVGKGLSLFKKGSVAGNLSVVLQQPTAYARAMMMVNPQYLLSSNPAKLAQNIKNMYKYSGVALIKNMGRFDTGTGKGAVAWMQDKITEDSKLQRVLDKTDKWTGMGAEKADEWTWGILWGAIERETQHTRPDLTAGTEEFYQAVAERFEDVVNHTQVYDSVLSKSEWMRSNTTMDKMVTSFMAEPTLTLNMLQDAIVNFRQNGGGKKVARAAATFLVNSALVAIAKSIVTATRRKDDEGRTWLEKYLAEAAGNFADDVSPYGLIGMIPWARDAVSLLEGYSVERSDMDAIEQLVNAYKVLTNDNKSVEDKIQVTTGAVGNLFGIPVKNLWRDTEAILRNLFGGASANEPTTGRDVLYSVMDKTGLAIPFTGNGFGAWDSSRAAYYDRMEEALKAGDMDRYNELRGYVEDTLQVKADTVTSGIKDEIKKSFTGGLISDDRAIELLEALGMDGKKAFDAVNKWQQTAGHEDEEDFEYNKYGNLQSMIVAGQDISAEVKRFTDHGTSEKTMESAVKGAIKDLYTAGSLTDSQAESSIKKYLGITDKDEIHWLMDEWAYKRDNGAEASYSKYVDVYDAVKNGTSLTAAMQEMTQNGYTEKDVRGQIRSKISEWYKKGELTKAQTESKLKQYAGITDSNDLYWAMDQLDYEKKNPKGEYRKYNEFYKAVETGSGLQSTVKKYMDHGVKAETMAGQITSQYKAQYVELYKKDKTKAVNLKARLLTAYAALGYDRNKKNKDIDKWVK